MNRWFADSFFFLALLSEDDDAHQRAIAVLKNPNRGFVTTEWVLAEVADAMCRPPSRQKFLEFWEFLKSHPLATVVQATHGQFEAAMQFYALRRDKDRSLTDSISFVTMREYGLSEALTGDHHFEQAGFRILLA